MLLFMCVRFVRLLKLFILFTYSFVRWQRRLLSIILSSLFLLSILILSERVVRQSRIDIISKLRIIDH